MSIPENLIKDKICPRCKRTVSEYETAYDNEKKAFGCTECLLDYEGGVLNGSENN